MSVVIDENKIVSLLDRRTSKLFPSKEGVLERLKKGDRITVYYGIDPTGPHIHLGHTVQLLFMKGLYGLGHKITLLIGDFTAQIGDPTDKDATRKPLTDIEIKNNLKTYLKQVYKILPKGSFKVVYNSNWLKKMSFADVLRLAGDISVQQMLTRDMFQERIKNEKTIGVHEFLYPLMHGYDSVALKVDGEIGGNDQMFNMLVGRDLVKKYLKKDKLVFITKLLVDSSTGKKMSKSEGDIIAIDDTPKDVFGKTMSTPDEMIKTIFELCTEISTDKVNEMNGQLGPKEFKEALAFELTKMYHGEEEAQKAKEGFKKVFSAGETPQDIQEFKPEDGRKSIKTVLLDSRLLDSKSEIKRLVDQGAIDINGEVIRDYDYQLKEGDIVKVGPRRFLKII